MLTSDPCPYAVLLSGILAAVVAMVAAREHRQRVAAEAAAARRPERVAADEPVELERQEWDERGPWEWPPR